MTCALACPLCSGGPLIRHGSRQVDVAFVDRGRLRWERAGVERMMCRSCGRTSGRGADEAEASMRLARAFVLEVYAKRGMEAAVDASGLTDRTVERWVETETEERLAGPLPGEILLTVAGRHALVSDAADGRVLDAACGEAGDIADLLSGRGGDVAIAWIWPAMRLKEAVERAFPHAELRMPPAMARERLDALLEAVDEPGAPLEARRLWSRLSERVAASGWDEPCLSVLQAFWNRRGGVGDGFLTLWRDEILAGLGEAGPAKASVVPVDSLLRLRARLSVERANEFGTA
jgi:hypothetical protein